MLRIWRRNAVEAGCSALGIVVLVIWGAATVEGPRAGDVEAAGFEVALEPGAEALFGARAFCRGRMTSSGTPARSGIASADPDVLPLGSVVRVTAAGAYDGIYTVMHKSPEENGRRIGIYLRDCDEARAFGQRQVELKVLRFGWQPQLSVPSS